MQVGRVLNLAPLFTKKIVSQFLPLLGQQGDSKRAKYHLIPPPHTAISSDASNNEFAHLLKIRKSYQGIRQEGAF